MRTYSDADDDDTDPSEMDLGTRDESSEYAPCPYCGEMIYEDAERCPECGKYLSEEDSPSKQPRWVWVTVVICVLLIIFFWIIF
jgi:predicted nucleic acid-binding Zn ribbon protein